MKSVRKITLVVFSIFICMLTFEFYRYWDSTYHFDNTKNIVIYSILIFFIFIFYFFIPTLYIKIEPHIRFNVDDEIKSIRIKNKQFNRIQYLINDIIIIYSYRKNEPKYVYKQNSDNYVNLMNDWHKKLIYKAAKKRFYCNSEKYSHYIEFANTLKYPTRYGEMTHSLYKKYLKSYYKAIQNVLIEINNYYSQKRINDYILFRNNNAEFLTKQSKPHINIPFYRIIIILVLFLALYIGTEYVQIQKELAKNGIYVPVDDSFQGFSNYNIMDTRTGNVYDKNGKLVRSFKVSNE